MNIRITVAAIFIGISGTTNAFGGDLLPAYLTEGAIVCPYSSAVNVAVMAHARNDVTWFLSTGCLQLSGKPAAIIIDGGTRYAWRVRVPRIEKTVYVPFNHVLANYRGKTMSWLDYHKIALGMEIIPPAIKDPRLQIGPIRLLLGNDGC